MKPRYLFGVVFFFFMIALGVFVAQFSWNGVVYLSEAELRNARSPAAIRRDLDFSLLNGADLVTASQKRLVTAARTVSEKGDIGIELGHFVTRGADGRRELACDVYDRVSLRFEAEGIAEGGEKPTMEVESPCTMSRDITMIEAVWIPVQRIMSERSTDMDLSLDERNGSKVSFKFSNMTSDWPTQWRLASVRLSDNDQKGPEVSLAGRELRDLLKKPMVLNWVPGVDPAD